VTWSASAARDPSRTYDLRKPDRDRCGGGVSVRSACESQPIQRPGLSPALGAPSGFERACGAAGVCQETEVADATEAFCKHVKGKTTDVALMVL
jgi:hypothetical protein